MTICIIGTGYVGLVTGTCLADLGNTVICVDKDPLKLALLKSGKSPIHEPGLDDLLEKNIAAGRLTFSDHFAQSVTESSLIFIAVGTPQSKTGQADISNVIDVAQSIADTLLDLPKETLGYRVIINKSTVPIGMGKMVENILLKKGVTKDCFGVVSNPEFLREGSAIADFLKPDRIVLGSADAQALEVVSGLYEPLYRIEVPIIKTDLETAELIKYASNAFLATKISFINEMSRLCDLVGADVHQVAKGMGTDHRIGKHFLHPGPGYGGSCFPKDTQALIHISKEVGYDLKIVQAVETVNEAQKRVIVDKVTQVFGQNLQGKTFGLLGLTFKPNTDDMREAPSLVIIEALLAKGARIQAYDPVGMDACKRIIGDNIYYARGVFEALDQADAMILLTEWNDFLEIDFEKVKLTLKTPIIFDARNIYDPGKMKKLGFQYTGIGRS